MKMNCYKMVNLLALCIFLLTACSNGQNVSSPSRSSNQNNEHNEVNNNVQNPYIVENDYVGEQLELVKLLNLSTKYRNEANSDEFMKLISSEPDTPIKQMNTKKVVDMKISNIGEITGSQGSIVTMTTTEDDSEGNLVIYVFHKINGEWRIYDID